MYKRHLTCALVLVCGACAHHQQGPGPELAAGREPSLPPYHPTQEASEARPATPGPLPAAPGPAPLDPLKIHSDFETDTEGWTVTGDAQRTSVKPDYSGQGGNPGGLISAKDDVTGGTFYFVAPEKYLGDKSSSYGGHLSFDLKTSSLQAPFKAYGVMLSGAGYTVIATLPYDPEPVNSWRTYVIALDPSAGWKLVPNISVPAEADFTQAQQASERELRAVLGALTTLRIRGEYNTGPDTGSLDNVHLGDK
jgi:hypothetical protein